MTEQDSGARDPREEAERLIASVLGSASLAAENLSGFATGSAECCVCPVCKAIAAAREPNPQVAEKLAAGAGEFASGVASFLRTVARAAGDFGAPGGTGGGGTAGGGTGGQSDAGGQSGAAGPAGSGGQGPRPAGGAAEDPWRTATRAAAAEAAAGTAKADTGAAASPAPGAAKADTGAAASPAPGAAEPAAPPNPPRPMAKKAVKPKAPAEPPAAPVDSPSETDEER